MNENHDHETEARIRDALNARSEATVVSADAMDKIRSGSSSALWARPVVYAAVAGTVAVIIGAALYLGPNETADPIDTAEYPTITLPPVTTAPPETTEPEVEAPTDVPTVPAEFDPRAVNADGIAGANLGWHPLDVVAAGLEVPGEYGEITPETTAQAFVVGTLGLSEPVTRDATVALPDQISTLTGSVKALDVMQMTEAGEVGLREAFTIVLVQVGEDPWVVTHVFTNSFRVHTVETNTPETLRVTGTGSAFEGTGILNVGLEDTILAVGGGGFDDFSVVVPRPAEDAPIQVMVSSPVVVEGQFPNVATYLTWPIDTSTTLSVFGVAADDVLNVRSGAGTSNEIVNTLGPETSGILHTGSVAIVNGERWWEIDAAGARGWVNSRFLVVNRDISLTGRLDERILESILLPIESLDPSLFAPQVDIGGIGVYADWPTPFTTIAIADFDEVRNWSPDGTDDRRCDCDMAVEQFLGFDTARWNIAEYSAPATEPEGENWGWSHGLPPEFFDRFTTGSIFIPEPNPDESLDWRRYTVVFDFVDGTPVIRGIHRWGWTP